MTAQNTTTDSRTNASSERVRSHRGFAAIDPQRQREIASLGGRAAHASGNAHRFTSEEARAAGAKSRSGRNAGKAQNHAE